MAVGAAIAGGAASIYGASQASGAASDAARAQEQFGQASLNFQRNQLQQNRRTLEPFVSFGRRQIPGATNFTPRAQENFLDTRFEDLDPLAHARSSLQGDVVGAAGRSGQAASDIANLRGFSSSLNPNVGGLPNPDVGPLPDPNLAGGVPDADLGKLSPIIDPETILNNPLFTSLAKDVQQRLFASQAAGGKFGSGDTAVRLGERLLPLGIEIAEREFDRKERAFGRDEREFQRQHQNLGVAERDFDRTLQNVGVKERQFNRELENVKVQERNFERAFGLEQNAVDRLKAVAGLQSAEENNAFNQLITAAATEENLNSAAFNREADRIRVGSGLTTNEFNRLLSMVQIGANSASGSATLSTGGIANTIEGIGNVRGAGIIGEGNATVGATNNITSLIGALLGSGAFGGSSSSTGSGSTGSGGEFNTELLQQILQTGGTAPRT